MGREIRKVKAGWEHPKRLNPYRNEEEYIGMLDESLEMAIADWKKDREQWFESEYDEYAKRIRGINPDRAEAFEEFYGSCPDAESECYRPNWTPEEMTHFQVYETVSEGTPVTPAFDSKDKLIQYLINYGDYWDQHRGNGPWSEAAAQQFVNNEWAPSMIVANNTVFTPRDGTP